MNTVIELAVSILAFGSLYALLATGLALVWGTLGVFNFAHGALLMVGALGGWYLVSNAGLSIWIALPIAVVGSALLGWLVYIGAVAPFTGRREAEWVTIISTLVIATILEDGAQTIFGGAYRPVAVLVGGNASFGPVAVSWEEVLIAVVGPAILGLLSVFLRRSKLGVAVRAVAQNLEAARLLGIPVQFVYGATFAVAAGLAGLAGILYGGEFGFDPTMGESLLLIVFVVVVLGGLASLVGTIVGAYVVSLITTLAGYFLGLFWAPAILFLALLVVLSVRPEGLLGRRRA